MENYVKLEMGSQIMSKLIEEYKLLLFPSGSFPLIIGLGKIPNIGKCQTEEFLYGVSYVFIDPYRVYVGKKLKSGVAVGALKVKSVDGQVKYLERKDNPCAVAFVLHSHIRYLFPIKEEDIFVALCYAELVDIFSPQRVFLDKTGKRVSVMKLKGTAREDQELVRDGKLITPEEWNNFRNKILFGEFFEREL